MTTFKKHTEKNYLKAIDIAVEVTLIDKWCQANAQSRFELYDRSRTILGAFEVHLELGPRYPFMQWATVLTQHIEAFISNTYPELGNCNYIDSGLFRNDNGDTIQGIKMWYGEDKNWETIQMIFCKITEVLGRQWVGDPKKALIPL